MPLTRLKHSIAYRARCIQWRYDLLNYHFRYNKQPSLGFRNVPVIINSYNRLTYLLELLSWLQRAGMSNIYILDNASTYPPLLSFYERTRYRIVRLGYNAGAFAFWSTALYAMIRTDFYIYTDPDVMPTEDCPLDCIEYFLAQLRSHKCYIKIGFGLKIDDLPNCYNGKQDVIDHEREFWSAEISPGIFSAPVDTTFALYRPYCRGGWWVPALRTGAPYLARHLPWYADSKNETEEDRYYRLSCRTTECSWSDRIFFGRA